MKANLKSSFAPRTSPGPITAELSAAADRPVALLLPRLLANRNTPSHVLYMSEEIGATPDHVALLQQPKVLVRGVERSKRVDVGPRVDQATTSGDAS